MAVGAELLYGRSNTQAGTSLVVNWWRSEEEQTEVNVDVRPRPVVSLLSPFTLNHHLRLRSHPAVGPNCSDVGYAACHRGIQECDLCKELANFRWIQLDGVFSFKEKKQNKTKQGLWCYNELRKAEESQICSHVGIYLTNYSTACFLLIGERKQLPVLEEAHSGALHIHSVSA